MKKISLILFAIVVFVSCFQENRYDERDSEESLSALQKGFTNPPQSARTRVWWHWMNGNVTKDGIRKDLMWMKRIGLGGFQNFDAALATPTVVDKRLVYMDEGWQDAFAYSVKLADSLGLEVAIASAPGWSSTGGPWVKPENAMKKLVWKSTVVSGGKTIDMDLPSPDSTTGAFLNGAPVGRGQAEASYKYYDDIAVIAMRIPEGRETAVSAGAEVTSSSGHFTLSQLTDGDITNGSILPRDDKEGSAWIQYAFPKPQTIRSLTVVGVGGGGFGGSSSNAFLECSDDGQNFTKVCDLHGGSVVENTLSIPETTAKYFRLRVRNPQGGFGGFFGLGGGASPKPKGTLISEFELFPYSRVNRFEDKAGFSAARNLTSVPTPTNNEEIFPSPEDVLDITDKCSGGRLTWDAPVGDWKIFRFGYSLTGKQNHPAPPEATGLEVDKLDPKAWTDYFRTYLDMYKKASGGLMGRNGVQYVLTDSYEAEQETWTPAMFEEFKARRGYDMRRWMPVLAGEVIGSPERSDAFLWDWRQTLGDLIAANYDFLTVIAQKEYGMLGRYTESHEAGRAYVGDGMDLKRTAQVPMGAMWVTAPWLPETADGDINRGIYNADDKESASVAHIYGQNIAAAESMTAPGMGGMAYSYCPENLKFIADIEMSNGINRFVIHESAHQPVDDKIPGLSLGGIGQWFNRHDTWAEMAGIWADYMARSCFMLQAGKNVADILYYYGEDSNVTTEFGSFPANVPAGFEWDYCSPDALLNHINFKKGRLVSDSGTQYRVLWIDRNFDYVSVKVLRKLSELAAAGAVIAAPEPKHPASLLDSQEEFDSLVVSIWHSGKKNVYHGGNLTEVMDAEGIEADVVSPGGIKFLHRTLPGAEVYWINKPSKDFSEITVSFRVKGLKAQIWHPDNGLMEDASYRVIGERTEVDMKLVPDDAVFVVFALKGEKSHKAPAVSEHPVESAKFDAPWTVKFQKGRGAPAEAVFETLQSFTESSIFGIKYFSGIATYLNTFSAGKSEGRTVLDLGSVKNIAEVYVNGKYCGTAWKVPFRVDVTDALKEGENALEVRVADLWVNRLIGDEQPDCPEKITFVDAKAYKASDKLQSAGLLGPVTLINIK